MEMIINQRRENREKGETGREEKERRKRGGARRGEARRGEERREEAKRGCEKRNLPIVDDMDLNPTKLRSSKTRRGHFLRSL